MLAVLGLMLVVVNAEVFFQEDFTGTALFLASRMADGKQCLTHWQPANNVSPSTVVRTLSNVSVIHLFRVYKRHVK